MPSPVAPKSVMEMVGLDPGDRGSWIVVVVDDVEGCNWVLRKGKRRMAKSLDKWVKRKVAISDVRLWLIGWL